MFEPRDIQTAESLSNAAGPALFEWIRTVVFTKATWPDFRRLYKLAERLAAPALIAEFLLRIDAEPLGRSEPPSTATIGYFKRRGRRFLRQLAQRDVDAYETIALSLLSRAGLGSASLPNHFWITWHLLFGGRARRRAAQARNGRGAYRLLSPRPTVSCPLDSLPERLGNEMHRCRGIAEEPRLPWQTQECAVVRLRLQGVLPEPSPELCVAYLESPSPLLHALVANYLAADAVAWASLPPELVAKCLFESPARFRRLMLGGLEQRRLADDWRKPFAATLFRYLEQDALHPRRCVDALEAVVKIAVVDPLLLDTPRLVSTLARLNADTQAACARVIAKCHKYIPCTCESLYPFVVSTAPTVRRIGWWLANKQLHSGAERGELWQKLLVDGEQHVASTLADAVAVAIGSDSIVARAAIVGFLVSHPQHIIPILSNPSSPSHGLAVMALRNPPKELRFLLEQICILLHGDLLRKTLYAILDGASNRKHYSWVLEWMMTSYSDQIRGIFWEWCCERRNEKWLCDNLPHLGQRIDKELADAIASRGRVAIRLAKAGAFDLGLAWASSVTKGLKSLARTGGHKDLVELLAHVPDKHWSGCARSVARRLAGDTDLNSAFWAAFFAEARGGRGGLDRVIASEPLRDRLAATASPSFLKCDTEELSPLVEHWIVSNPAAFDDHELVMQLAENRNAALRSHALRRLRESPCDFVTALRLIETGLPDACELGAGSVEQLWHDPDARAAMTLELIDSPRPQARELGWDLFVRLYEENAATPLLSRIAECEDERIVANLLALTAKDPKCAGTLTTMRERVLLTTSSTRSSKEEVKRHVTACHEAVDPVLLQRVAHGAAKCDRDWAIEQLVVLRQSGKPVDGVDVVQEGFV